MTKTRHPKIFIGDISGPPPHEVASTVDQLAMLARAGDEVSLRLLLNDFLVEANLDVPLEIGDAVEAAPAAESAARMPPAAPVPSVVSHPRFA
jgi:hypothetical protein